MVSREMIVVKPGIVFLEEGFTLEQLQDVFYRAGIERHAELAFVENCIYSLPGDLTRPAFPGPTLHLGSILDGNAGAMTKDNFITLFNMLEPHILAIGSNPSIMFYSADNPDVLDNMEVFFIGCDEE